MLKNVLLVLVVVTLGFSLSGCGGSSTKTTVTTTETQGQQLLDLKKAFEQGAINEKEYKRAKNEILDQ